MFKLSKYLKEMGFVEIKPKLWRKVLENNTAVYRDYRNSEPVSYAYLHSNPIPIENIKEVKAIKAIEGIINDKKN